MKSFALLFLGILACAQDLSGADILIEPLPPVGSEISVSNEGVVDVKMDKAGTVILGRCKVEALPENYIIIFTAEGMATELNGGGIALVLYALDGKDIAGRAYGGTNMISSSAKWSGLRTSYLAKATKQYDQIMLGVNCEVPCNIRLRNFKVEAMTRLEFERRVDERRKKATTPK
ncbi:hypothetical protein [Roseimicrobium sp. ORNL1]|uniref:hypothetical protein n=1 Tax=Roseimicrobium sp. ORNL1 TaxID=2711231 RepID=UPI0013E1AC97|nr:hypothetical protein [Roseimicrobium sp. ORNL1]QIF00052.1 hypothetical protein G5S37_00455 [Roseimicrobium sp. ORNL1]